MLDLLEPDNIYEIVSTVDYGELIDSLNIQIPTQEGQDPEATEEYVEQILSSDMGKDLLDTFADRLADGKDLSQKEVSLAEAKLRRALVRKSVATGNK